MTKTKKQFIYIIEVDILKVDVYLLLIYPKIPIIMSINTNWHFLILVIKIENNLQQQQQIQSKLLIKVLLKY